jgi:PTH1 family peptidyl-tRNA hydrolase
MSDIEILLGIGNIGDRYVSTRHNIGCDIVRRFVEKNGFAKKRKFEHSHVWECEFGAKSVFACHPDTFVNNSGLAARELLDFLGINEAQMLVVVDDFNLALGTLRFRANGSDGGHNGLKSLIECSSKNFPRLRFGIGMLPENTSVVDFVLGKLNEEEIQTVNEKLDFTVQAIECYLNDGIVAAMNGYNSK